MKASADKNFAKVCETLGRQLKARRERMGLSQEALALRAEVDRTYVSKLERAIGNPSILVLCRLADVLETDVLDLLRR